MKSTRSSDMAVSLSSGVTSLDRPGATNSSGPFGCFGGFAVLDHVLYRASERSFILQLAALTLRQILVGHHDSAR
jgi:hypothetical protein